MGLMKELAPADPAEAWRRCTSAARPLRPSISQLSVLAPTLADVSGRPVDQCLVVGCSLLSNQIVYSIVCVQPIWPSSRRPKRASRGSDNLYSHLSLCPLAGQPLRLITAARFHFTFFCLLFPLVVPRTANTILVVVFATRIKRKAPENGIHCETATDSIRSLIGLIYCITAEWRAS